ncbi:hypothetical protein WICPIJ_003328 [Wickerhamomyces pijperi]|uniref:Uncharacterized protein n=1 Tax=Wickerhamomyces pijperi TaxID=599730 RepID=A0A9P8Q810_WICPI|nr:hypothetical protein WICPIJ_003328 [Wickerhamomyces pijperi]
MDSSPIIGRRKLESSTIVKWLLGFDPRMLVPEMLMVLPDGCCKLPPPTPDKFASELNGPAPNKLLVILFKL